MCNQPCVDIKDLVKQFPTLPKLLSYIYSIETLIEFNNIYESYSENKNSLLEIESKLTNYFSITDLYTYYNSDIILLSKIIMFNSKTAKDFLYPKDIKLMVLYACGKIAIKALIESKVKLLKIINKLDITFYQKSEKIKFMTQRFEYFLKCWGSKDEFEDFKKHVLSLEVKTKVKKDIFSVKYLRYLYIRKVLDDQIEPFNKRFSFEHIKNKFKIFNVFGTLKKETKEVISKTLQLNLEELNFSETREN